ncbi:D-alanine--poly(phosphoribitol) ligase subunit DltC [Bacillus thuringiensis]|uniref:D-alanyl carrier protein n=1 Tax=Bacillus thuringiensis subsp. jegathesan TaxID=56955 RepID=A0A9X6M4Z5_BACTJ|nr:D-alanine--poly(phosphoribitol) ligase subunit DltC [Bacillus thuringiensis]OUB66424.1 D-alanine--poly(phosphoribitol) ligase subunit 2 [Bacillus thuringiensis serovar jegathesan]
MTKFKNQVLDILEEVCENDIVKENPDVELFEEGILDSFGTVSLLVEFQERLGIEVSISDFDRDQWTTPNMISNYSAYSDKKGFCCKVF